MQQGKLTHAWTTAEASKPLGWHLEGLFRVDGDQWQAVAIDERGRQFGNEAGNGSTPEQALYDLAEQLRRRRGDPNG